MKHLSNYFIKHTHREIFKWSHYFDIYESHFGRFINKSVNVLVIGISHGGSLQMWKYFFGQKAKIYGVDINPYCQNFQEKQIKIFIGSQSDRVFLRDLKSKIPRVDILIDDGGHQMEEQIISFEELFDFVSPNGIYLCEDLHTSYWEEYGGGYKNPRSYIEYSKNFIDYINAFHSKSDSLQINAFTESVQSLHYYDSILGIEKGKKEAAFALKSGEKSLP